jgi:hypothetical protein
MPEVLGWVVRRGALDVGLPPQPDLDRRSKKRIFCTLKSEPFTPKSEPFTSKMEPFTPKIEPFTPKFEP